MTASPCRICGASQLEVFSEFEALPQVTSDCRPWPAGGRLAACLACGVVQKPAEPRWETDCRAIYANYLLYPQGGGSEQAVFDTLSGASAGRSDRLLEKILSTRALPPEGRILDIGCGNGAFLRAFQSRAKQWRLNGAELHDRYRHEIERIPGLESFHQCLPEQIAGEFDWIVFLHVLEHLPAPTTTLDHLRSKLRPGGLVLIELPDHHQNPFDLAVADHACHFSLRTLREVIQRSGYATDALADDWIPRELTALARPDRRPPQIAPDIPAALAGARAGVDWLARMRQHARALASSSPIGVFGSSIGATWLLAALDGRVAFFLDEDPHRKGRFHCDRPILALDQAPTDVPIYIALPPAQARSIQERLSSRNLRLVLPPDFDPTQPVPGADLS